MTSSVILCDCGFPSGILDSDEWQVNCGCCLRELPLPFHSARNSRIEVISVPQQQDPSPPKNAQGCVRFCRATAQSCSVIV